MEVLQGQLDIFSMLEDKEDKKMAVCTKEYICRGNKIAEGDELEVMMEQGDYYIFWINNNYEGIKKEYFKLKDDIDLTEDEEKKLILLEKYATKDQMKSIKENIDLREVKEAYIDSFKYDCSNRHHIFFKTNHRVMFMSVFGTIVNGWDVKKEERIYILGGLSNE